MIYYQLVIKEKSFPYYCPLLRNKESSILNFEIRIIVNTFMTRFFNPELSFSRINLIAEIIKDHKSPKHNNLFTVFKTGYFRRFSIANAYDLNIN